MEPGEADDPAACSSPAVFEAGNGRYTLDLDDEVEILNPSDAETADTVEVLRFRHEIEGVPRTFVIYAAEDEPIEAIEQLSAIDDRYGIPDEELVKIHFHTNEPWQVLEYCASLGEIYDIVVEDMDRQSRGLHG